MAVRRVVTGQTDDGTSVVVSDEGVEPVTVSLLPGTQFHRLWGANTPPTLPTGGTPPDQSGYFPPPGGYRFGFFTLGPDAVTLPEDLDLGAALAELDENLPGLATVMEPDHPGMHTTDTVDLDLVVSGEVWLELDDGAEVHLRAGDCVVQNGTRHAWHNRTSEPAVLFVTLLGAVRSGA
ncbi:MAG TPA: cupin domain-containing protein [Acidimicrobiales bacterium]|nr:cupin domain-containing protein [Acidimicrobiales bacterium]